MSEIAFAAGARGTIVRHLQRRLQGRGFHTIPLDGVYGEETAGAVRGFQESRELPPTGAVDPATWRVLSALPFPSLRDRCLNLTAALDGRDFGLAQGNIDGTGITWGITGFTLQSGEIRNIVRAAFAQDQLVVRSCFEGKTNELMKMLDQPWARQLLWAEELTVEGALAEPWHSAFARFGDTEIGQRLQLERVERDYFTHALASSKAFGFTTETGVALCFDIHGQNGGVTKEMADSVRVRYKPGMNDLAVRELLADAVAEAAKPKVREEIRERKLMIARGVPNWGIAEIHAP